MQTAVLTTLDIVLAVGGYIILLFTIDWRLALLSLVPLPIWTYYIIRFSKIVQPAAKAVMEADDKNVSLIAEAIAGVHVIKAFATERQEMDKYGGNLDEFLGRTLKRIRLFADFNPVIRTIAMASYLTLFLLAGILMIHGTHPGWRIPRARRRDERDPHAIAAGLDDQRAISERDGFQPPAV